MPKKRHSGLPDRMARFWFGLTRRAQFYADMAAFLDVGQAPTEILENMQLVANRRRALRNLAHILRATRKALVDGESTLGVALSPWLPPVEATMIASGEEAGTLMQSFRELAWTVGEQARIREAAKKKLIPIGVLLVAAFGLMVYVTTLVVPQAAAMITPEVMDDLIVAPIYIAVGEAFLGNLPLVVGGMIGVVVAAMASLSRWTGAQRKLADRFPIPWGVYSWTQASFFLSTASAMLKNGIIFRDVLAEIGRNTTPWQRWHLRRMDKSIAGGKPPVEAMDTGMLPDAVIDRLLMYAKLPSFPDAMSRLAKDSVGMYEKTLDTLTNILQIATLLGLALFIVVTVGSMMEIALAVADAAQAPDAATL